VPVNTAAESAAFDVAVRALVAPFVRPKLPRIALGAIVLSESQAVAAMQAHQVIERWGGVLLGDATGAGKTYIALALTAGYTQPVIVAPAALRSTWEQALRRSKIEAAVVSYESLSRNTALPPADIVICDEAHQLRTSTTRRYRAAQRLCAEVPVVLVSATPVHNRLRDRDALVALFLGVDAEDLDDATRAALVVRGGTPPGTGPRVRSAAPIAIPDVPSVVDAILTLPAAVPPRDGGTAPELWRIGLLRAWCSSTAALDATIRRAELRIAALVDAWREGRAPSRAELSAWGGGDDTQLALAALVAPLGDVAEAQLADAQLALQHLRALRASLPAHEHVDEARVAALRAIRAAHPGVPILACAQFGATVLALGRLLRNDREVATLTAQRGRIASGPISRDAVLARFAPVAQGQKPPSARERISLLIATDVVSEGLNLQDAGVIVHLDTPWTPARIAQRVGRLTRPGSPHAVVHEHTITAPHAAAARLQMERRLAEKQLAADVVQDAAEAARVVRERLHELGALFARDHTPHVEPIMTAVSGHAAGVLALLGGGAPRLIGSLDGQDFTDDPRVIATLLGALLNAVPATLSSSDRSVLARLQRWLDCDTARHVAMTTRPAAARFHRHSLAESQQRVANAPAHERATLAAVEAQHFTAARSLPDRMLADEAPPNLSVAIIIRIARRPFP
jgi:superfamily II DNA or RNA helicase